MGTQIAKNTLTFMLDTRNLYFHEQVRVAGCDGQGRYQGRCLKVCPSAGANWYNYHLVN